MGSKGEREEEGGLLHMLARNCRLNWIVLKNILTSQTYSYCCALLVILICISVSELRFHHFLVLFHHNVPLIHHSSIISILVFIISSMFSIGLHSCFVLYFCCF